MSMQTTWFPHRKEYEKSGAKLEYYSLGARIKVTPDNIIFQHGTSWDKVSISNLSKKAIHQDTINMLVKSQRGVYRTWNLLYGSQILSSDILSFRMGRKCGQVN